MLEPLWIEKRDDSSITPKEAKILKSNTDFVSVTFLLIMVFATHKTKRITVATTTNVNLLNSKNSVVIGKKKTGSKKASPTIIRLTKVSIILILLDWFMH